MRLRRPDVPFPQTRDAYAAVGDSVVVPKALDGLDYSWLEDDGRLAFKVTVDVRYDDGGPRTTRLVVEEGTHRLTRKLLSGFDPDAFAYDALAGYGFTTSGPERRIFTPDPEAASAALASLPKRRSVTKARLADVAAAYQRGGAVAVQHDCDVSKSQAYRLVGQARGAGLLPKVER